MAILLFNSLAFACISFASPLVPQLLDPPSPAAELSSLSSSLPNQPLDVWKANLTLHSSTPDDGSINETYSASPSALNVSAPRGDFHCFNPGSRGEVVTVQQCSDALQSLPNSPDLFTHEVTFGPREYNLFNVGLPRLYLSCT